MSSPFLFMFVYSLFEVNNVNRMKRYLLSTVWIFTACMVASAQQVSGTMQNATAAFINNNLIVFPFTQTGSEEDFKYRVYNAGLDSPVEQTVPLKGVKSATIQREGNGFLFKCAMDEGGMEYALVHVNPKGTVANVERVSKSLLSEQLYNYRENENYMFAKLEVPGANEGEVWGIDVLPWPNGTADYLYARVTGVKEYKGPPYIVGGIKDKTLPGLYNRRWTVGFTPLKEQRYRLIPAGVDTVAIWIHATYRGKTNASMVIMKVSTGKQILNKEVISPTGPAYAFSDMIYYNGAFYTAGAYVNEAANANGADGYFMMKIDMQGKVTERKTALNNEGEDALKGTGVKGKSVVVHKLSVVDGRINMVCENIAFKGSVPVTATYAIGVQNPASTTVSDEAFSYGFTFASYSSGLDLLSSTFAGLQTNEKDGKRVVDCKCTDMVTCATMGKGTANGAAGILTDEKAGSVIYKIGKGYFKVSAADGNPKYEEVIVKDDEQPLFLGTSGRKYFVLTTNNVKPGQYLLQALLF